MIHNEVELGCKNKLLFALLNVTFVTLLWLRVTVATVVAYKMTLKWAKTV